MGKGDSRSDHRERDRGGERERTSRREGAIGGGGRGGGGDRNKERLSREDRRLRNEGEPKGHSSSRGDASSSKSTPTTTKTSSSSAPTSSSISDKDKGSREGISSFDKKELYEKLVSHENTMAKQLDVAQAVRDGQETSNELERRFQEVFAFLKSSPEDQEELQTHVRKGLVKISSVRATNRCLKLRLKSVKDDQLVTRTVVDSEHLLLQNLLYEAEHLQKQVAAMQNYRGMDESIDLIPVDEFYQVAPESISKPDLTKSDGHLLRIARLEHEFLQRQKLTEECKALDKKLESVNKNISETQERLDSVEPMLSNILEATKPAQEFLGLDMSAKREQNDIAQYLPAELYVILVQSNGYKESRGNKDNWSINLRGNVDEARELVVTPDEADDDSDSDKEKEQDLEIENSRRRLMRKKSSICISADEMRKKLVQRHPLWIEWIIKSAKDSSAVCVQFFYLLKLKIVTVKAKAVDDLKQLQSHQGELASSDSLLEELFPEDVGLESPNPSNAFLFNRVDAKGISDFVSEVGRPYTWAQRLAGLEFPSSCDITPFEEIVVRPNANISAANVGKVLKAIKMRLSNQTVLSTQLKLLENKNIQVPPEAKKRFCPKISTSVKAWEPIPESTYRSYSFTKEPLRTGAVSHKNLYYKAVLERSRAYATALVAIPSDFPFTPPIFAIQLEKDGEKRNSRNDAVVRQLESEVNVHSVDEFQQWPEYLISLQLTLLAQGIDIILETDQTGESAGPSEFGKEKLVSRISAGRNQRRPFMYNATGGGYFTQRY